MKIAIDVRRIRDFGVGTYIRNLLNALGAADTRNEYCLISPPANARELAHLPPNFRPVLYARGDEDRLDHFALPILLRELRPDLAHMPFNRVPLFMPKPYVVTVHDLSSLLFEQSTGAMKDLRRFRFRRGLSRASRVVAVSAATRRDVQNILSIPEARLRLVYNAPDPQFFGHRHLADARAAGPEAADRERNRILERYQIHYPFLLYAGNIRPQKNIPRLVEAFAVVRTDLAEHPVYRDLRLIIIGDEISKFPSVRRAVIQSRVEHSVRFLGFVPFDTLRFFYELAAAFVFPSLYEGFGLPPLEAMASGTPVVTSNASSLPEAVGDAAMLVNPENVFDIARGIKEVLLNDDLRANLICKGKIHAASFSWDRTAREMIEIYGEALE
ncbi:MAG: glycosyltransferase family 4 protein [Acidobacteriota bacterium]|nr:glycosyltransferase family 4 protein [Acidobacteriota bacterium]